MSFINQHLAAFNKAFQSDEAFSRLCNALNMAHEFSELRHDRLGRVAGLLGMWRSQCGRSATAEVFVARMRAAGNNAMAELVETGRLPPPMSFRAALNLVVPSRRVLLSVLVHNAFAIDINGFVAMLRIRNSELEEARAYSSNNAGVAARLIENYCSSAATLDQFCTAISPTYRELLGFIREVREDSLIVEDTPAFVQITHVTSATVDVPVTTFPEQRMSLDVAPANPFAAAIAEANRVETFASFTANSSSTEMTELVFWLNRNDNWIELIKAAVPVTGPVTRFIDEQRSIGKNGNPALSTLRLLAQVPVFGAKKLTDVFETLANMIVDVQTKTWLVDAINSRTSDRSGAQSAQVEEATLEQDLRQFLLVNKISTKETVGGHVAGIITDLGLESMSQLAHLEPAHLEKVGILPLKAVKMCTLLATPATPTPPPSRK